MRNLLGFLDRFRNKFWFNALALDGLICGGLLTIIYLKLYLFELLHLEYGMGFAFVIIPLFPVIILVTILKIELIVCYLVFTIFIWEQIFDKKITSKKFLNSKTIRMLQSTGIILFFIPLIFLLLIII
jgi:hypothetical protein